LLIRGYPYRYERDDQAGRLEEKVTESDQEWNCKEFFCKEIFYKLLVCLQAGKQAGRKACSLDSKGFFF
jgi:hypothetical protein